MKKYILLTLLLMGCGPAPPRQVPQGPVLVDFECRVEVEKVNGSTKTVVINRFPLGVRVTDRGNMDRLIATVESVLADLKEAREQFPVIEPPTKEGTFDVVKPPAPEQR